MKTLICPVCGAGVLIGQTHHCTGSKPPQVVYLADRALLLVHQELARLRAENAALLKANRLLHSMVEFADARINVERKKA